MAITLSDPWAPPAACVCDFGWYDHTGSLFPPLSYVLNGVTYPPADFTWSSGGSTYSSGYAAYVTPLGQSVTFDAADSLSLGIAKCVTPTGVQIISFAWELGNGQVGFGPQVSTTYNYVTPPPDAAVTLTITDSLGRVTSTRHLLNFSTLAAVGSNETLQRQGSGRT